MHKLPLTARTSHSRPIAGKGQSWERLGQKFFPRRPYITGLSDSRTNHEATNVAVLGGGITGLTTAYLLSRSLPNANITIIEASSRLGGWLHSQHVDVGNGHVVFERGPRNLRPTIPNGLITLDLVRRSLHYLFLSPDYG